MVNIPCEPLQTLNPLLHLKNELKSYKMLFTLLDCLLSMIKKNEGNTNFRSYFLLSVLMTAVPLAVATLAIQLTKLAQMTEIWPVEAIITIHTIVSSVHQMPKEFRMATLVTCTENEFPTWGPVLLWELTTAVMQVPCQDGGNTPSDPSQTVYWVATQPITPICSMVTVMVHLCNTGVRVHPCKDKWENFLIRVSRILTIIGLTVWITSIRTKLVCIPHPTVCLIRKIQKQILNSHIWWRLTWGGCSNRMVRGREDLDTDVRSATPAPDLLAA